MNPHNKAEYLPMHTAEHLLNGYMAQTYGCGRAFSAHVERTKSKLDYHLSQPLTESQLRAIEDYVNGVITADVPVTQEFITIDEARMRFDLSRLPDDAADTVRVVHIGDYDECMCAGDHVERTSQIGKLRISSARYQDGVQRIVFRLDA